MWQMLWPVLVVVGANTLYNICAKSTPAEINSFASLSLTYALSAVLSLIFFYFTSQQKNILAELSKANWTAFVLAFSIIFLEFGYICIYRAGWKVSAASLVANIALACFCRCSSVQGNHNPPPAGRDHCLQRRAVPHWEIKIYKRTIVPSQLTYS